MTRIGYVWSIKRSGGFHCWVIIININFSILAPRKLVLLYSSPSPGRTSSRNLHNEGHEIIHHRSDDKNNKIGLKFTFLVFLCTTEYFIYRSDFVFRKCLGSGRKTVKSQGYSKLREPIKRRENCYSLIWQILNHDILTCCPLTGLCSLVKP